MSNSSTPSSAARRSTAIGGVRIGGRTPDAGAGQLHGAVAEPVSPRRWATGTWWRRRPVGCYDAVSTWPSLAPRCARPPPIVTGDSPDRWATAGDRLPGSLAKASVFRVAKIVSLAQAVSELIRDGDTVALEGFTHLIPFAAAHEIIRQGRRGLTLARMTPDIVYDQLIGAGCAGS